MTSFRDSAFLNDNDCYSLLTAGVYMMKTWTAHDETNISAYVRECILVMDVWLVKKIDIGEK